VDWRVLHELYDPESFNSTAVVDASLTEYASHHALLEAWLVTEMEPYALQHRTNNTINRGDTIWLSFIVNKYYDAYSNQNKV
jgi:hypothetical protein